MILKEVQATPTKPDGMEAGVQTTPPSQRQVDAALQTDFDTPAEKPRNDSAPNERFKGEPVYRKRAKSPIHRDVARVKKGSSPRTSMVSDHTLPTSQHPLNSSLESEMRVAGVEVTDPYDSSEGIGFSDSNLDEVPDSTHSLESFKSDKMKDDSPLKAHVDEEKGATENAKSAVPMASSIVNQQPSSVGTERTPIGGVANMVLDLEEESSSDEHQSSNSSESELQSSKQQGIPNF